MMKTLARLILCIILSLAPLSRGFTRFARQIPVTNELSWDPVLQDIDIICQQISSLDTQSCHDMMQKTFTQTVQRRIGVFLEDFRRRYEEDFLQEYQWLDHTDGMTQTTILETVLEIRHLIDGRILPRPYCNHRERIRDARCSYYQYMNDIGVIGLQLSSDNLIVNLETNLFSFAKIAEDFFNNEEYEHAEGMAVFVIKNVILPLMPTSHFQQSREAFEEVLIKASIVVSEIEKLRGHLDHSTTFALNIISSYHNLHKLGSSAVDQSELYLFKLRALLHTPAIPPSYDVATFHRQQMVEDLQLYLELLQTKPSPNLSLSVSKFCSYSIHFISDLVSW